MDTLGKSAQGVSQYKVHSVLKIRNREGDRIVNFLYLEPDGSNEYILEAPRITHVDIVPVELRS